MTAIRGLGEVAFRTERLGEMVEFYGTVLGLDRVDDPPFDDSAFFRAGDGVGGHTQVLVLFDRSGSSEYVPPEAERTPVDHVAFGIERSDFDAEAERLEGLGYDLDYAYHDWVGWRSLYLHDPDGNHVELVCHDPEG
jgi:catechol 2,3-dioxygenase